MKFSLLSSSLPAAALAIALLALGGCSVDIGNGSQLAGQRCFLDTDCASGLVCRDRVCIPQAGPVVSSTPDMGAGDVSNPPDFAQPDVSRPDMGQLDVGIDQGVDSGGQCQVGDRRCTSANAYEICVDAGNGRSKYIQQQCSNAETCTNGVCQGSNACFDRDGDGYGRGCMRGPDCNDNDPLVNPGIPEFCSTPVDDNCNGQINEGCMQQGGCCDGGCPDGTFCSSQCMCQMYDPTQCMYQNQPCSQSGQYSNGYYCISIDQNSQPRCWGVCDITSDNPDSTCPDANTACAFDAGDNQHGICASFCGQDANGQLTCGDPSMGCLQVDVGSGPGICTPINPNNNVGDNCDPNAFFDCNSGLVCVQNGRNSGACQQACRPFGDPATTDCNAGDNCLPFSPDFGVCAQSNGFSEGDACMPTGTACSADAVGCYPNGQNGNNQCFRFCRLAQGDTDCPPDAAGVQKHCTQFDQRNTDLGICL